MLSDVLYIGSRRYSSWSMRGWLAVRLAGLAVDEIVVPLAGGRTPGLAELTPSGLVPALRHSGRWIWDSLAICEYCAELSRPLWPIDVATRATARSIAAEMHSGFAALRREMPMSLFRTSAAAALPADAQADIARIQAIWQACSLRSSGPFLFGPQMTIPDVMYAPVVARFLTYTPALSAESLAYCTHVRAAPLVQQWYDLAAAEPLAWRLARYE